MKNRIARLLNLAPEELGPILQFWLFYGTLAMMLQLGESLSMSLFLKRLGIQYLPMVYITVALLNILFSTLYTFIADRISNRSLFVLIILLSGLGFLGVTLLSQTLESPTLYGLFFIIRETSFTLLILHFGLYVRDFYSSEDSERTFPVIYASGRIGGLCAGAALTLLASRIGTLNLTYLYPVLALLSIVLIYRVEAALPPRHQAKTPKKAHQNLWSLKQGWANFSEGLRFVKTSELLLAMSVATALFVVLRYFLNLEYSSWFSRIFTTEDSLTAFLGLFSSISLAVATGVQLVVTSRLVKTLGVGMINLLFSLTMGVSFWGLLLWPGLYTAMLARFIETELRMSLRNPVMNMFYNAVPDTMRARARAFTFGMVLPLATLVAGIFLFAIEGSQHLFLITVLGSILSLPFLYFSWRQAVAYDASKALLEPVSQTNY